MVTKKGKQTLLFKNKPGITAYSSIVGKKEGEGPIGKEFDIVCEDTTFGQDTWEKSESKMQQDCVDKTISKSGMNIENIDILFAGDLLNQCTGSTYGLKDFNLPILGLYGACSTMAESLALASVFVESNVVSNALAVTSSHFCSAERQFRLPLEYGGQRTPTSQWTATASGSVLVSNQKSNIEVNAVCIGKIVDLGITDANNMGAAMAPAAADTLKTFFKETKTGPNDYDQIFTGDLGKLGSEMLYKLLMEENINIKSNHNDCGLIIYDLQKQDVHCGGSGCGCSASVLCSYILNRVADGRFKNIIFMATGALMSPTAVSQGQSIPGIAHLINIKYRESK